MPKGVIWRQKDLFVAALGGVGSQPAGEELDLTEVMKRVRSAPHSVVSAPPFMHGAAQWFSLPVLFRGGAIVMPNNNDYPRSHTMC